MNLGRDNSNGSTFDSTAKSDLNTFSVSSNSDFTLTYTFVKGGCHAIYVPGNAENAIIYHNRGTVYATTGSAICISSGAKNTNATIIGDYNYDCAGGFEDKGSNTTTGYIIFSKIDPPSSEPDWYT